MGRAFEYRKARKLKRWGNMARVFTKLGKEITIAVKASGPDPDTNPRLRVLMQTAKKENMPKENVERAIKKATDKDSNTDYKEMNYEGYGPHGIAIFVETATDNTTRTVANVRSYFNKFGGNLGTTGSLEFLFDHKCVFHIQPKEEINEEELILDLIDYGVEEIQRDEEEWVIEGDFSQKISQLKELLATSSVGLEGVADLEFIHAQTQQLGLQTATLELEVTLARGLNYYTGAIFEVAAPREVSLGSIGGGGRYDELTAIFGLKGMSGIGISFGLDRIYLVLEQLGLFPTAVAESLEVLCVNFGDREALASFGLVQQLRAQGYKAELYPEATKLKKQLAYADSRKVKYVVLIGEAELTAGTAVIKYMDTGEQATYPITEIGKVISKK